MILRRLVKYDPLDTKTGKSLMSKPWFGRILRVRRRKSQRKREYFIEWGYHNANMISRSWIEARHVHILNEEEEALLVMGDLIS
jgi:hypothetical protein